MQLLLAEPSHILCRFRQRTSILDDVVRSATSGSSKQATHNVPGATHIVETAQILFPVCFICSSYDHRIASVQLAALRQ